MEIVRKMSQIIKVVRAWRPIEFRKKGIWTMTKGIVSDSLICSRKSCNRKVNQNWNSTRATRRFCSRQCAARVNWRNWTVTENIYEALKKVNGPMSFMEIKTMTGHSLPMTRQGLNLLIETGKVIHLGRILKKSHKRQVYILKSL